MYKCCTAGMFMQQQRAAQGLAGCGWLVSLWVYGHNGRLVRWVVNNACVSIPIGIRCVSLVPKQNVNSNRLVLAILSYLSTTAETRTDALDDFPHSPSLMQRESPDD